MTAPVVEPSACRWCSIAEREHGRQFADAVGWHGWALPTQPQILARMQARRLAAAVARVGALPMPMGSAEPQLVNAPSEMPRWKGLGLEDPHDGPLHQEHLIPHDLPPLAGSS